MNNGMFVEMCAFVANRDLKNGQLQREYSETELEPVLTGVEASSATKIGPTSGNFWHFIKALSNRAAIFVPKKVSKEAHSKQDLALRK
jgi:hypothetical protein